LEELKIRIEEFYKTYEEPEFDKDGKYISKKIKKAPIINTEGLMHADSELQEE